MPERRPVWLIIKNKENLIKTTHEKWNHWCHISRMIKTVFKVIFRAKLNGSRGSPKSYVQILKKEDFFKRILRNIIALLLESRYSIISILWTSSIKVRIKSWVISFSFVCRSVPLVSLLFLVYCFSLFHKLFCVIIIFNYKNLQL